MKVSDAREAEGDLVDDGSSAVDDIGLRPKLHALVVEDDDDALLGLRHLVEHEGFTTEGARTLEEARAALEERLPDVALIDVVLPDGEGTELLEELAEKNHVESILVTGKASIETAVQALRLGAYDYLTKPVDSARLKVLLANLTRTKRLQGQVVSLRQDLRQLGRFGSMIGASSVMQRVYDLVERVAASGASVFIIGESGTGKELVAETLHAMSERSGPMLPLNCGAVSASLIESELFGHERGSFTGANRRHRGFFERASGGTLFLDEITEMPVELQVRLLRVLETGSLLRVGGSTPVDVDVRVIAATNRDPARAVKDRVLREDLYYRLNAFPIQLPPLCDRGKDIELLATRFLEQLNKDEGTNKRFTSRALDLLVGYRWPGNVRELKNTVQRAFILAEDKIDVDCLPTLQGLAPEETTQDDYLRIRIGSRIEDAERRLLLATLRKAESKKQAAETLGISLKTLYNRLKSYEEEGEGEAQN